MEQRTETRRDARRVTPRVVGAATITIVGGVVMVNGQPVSAAQFTVLNTDAAGPGSFRQAVIDANGSAGLDEIVFDPAVTGTINLGAGGVFVDDDLRILGPGQAVLTLTSDAGSVLYVYDNADLYISNLSIDSAGNDGIFVSDGDEIVVDSVTISGSVADGLDVENTTSFRLIDSVVSGSGDNGLEMYEVGSTEIRNSEISGNDGSGIDGEYIGGVSIIDSQITGNGSYGVYLEYIDGDVYVSGSTFSSNDGDGLNLYIVDGDVTIRNSTIQDNGGEGAYVQDIYGAVVIDEVDAIGNGSSGVYIDGVYGPDADVLVTNSSFISNGNEGFEIEQVEGDVTVRNVEVSDTGAGSFYISDVTGDVLVESVNVSGGYDDTYIGDVGGSVTVRDSSFTDNVENENLRIAGVDGPVLLERVTSTGAAEDGLVLDELGSGATIVNSTVTGNTDHGISVYDSELTVRHSTIVDNGLYGVYGELPEGNDASTIHLDHTIATGNTDGDFGGVGTFTADHSVLDVGSALTASGTGNIEAADALLEPLADNGGTTLTRRPQADSPAVDAGDPAVAGAPATDQRAAARIVGTIDIGAVERAPGQVDLAPATVTVDEAAGTAELTVTRSGGTEGAVSITVTTMDGTAAEPGDYTAVSQVISWADGESGAKAVSVPIVDDTEIENDETLTVSLSVPTGGVVIGADSSTVTITDDDADPATTTTTPSTTVPTPPTTDAGGGPVTLPPTGDDSTGPIAWIAGLFLALGAAATRIARRTTRA